VTRIVEGLQSLADLIVMNVAEFFRVEANVW